MGNGLEISVSGLPRRPPPHQSEREADAGDEGSRLQEVGPTEGGQKVIQCDLVGQVGYLERAGELFVPLRVEQVVAADAKVEDVARFHAIGIVVVVLLADRKSTRLNSSHL